MLKKVRDAINVLASLRTSVRGMFVDNAKLNPINHLPGTAGWNCTVLMYEPKQNIINGTWSFPKVRPAK